MKQMLFRAIAPGIALSCMAIDAYAQQDFTIEGKLAAGKKGLVRITYTNRDQTIMDSMQTTDGTFFFKGRIDQPVEAEMVLNPLYGQITYDQYISQDNRSFCLAPGKNSIASVDGCKVAVITNGQPQKDFEKITWLHTRFDELNMQLMQRGNRFFAEKNEKALQAVKDSMTLLRQQRFTADSLFISGNSSSYVAFDVFFELNFFAVIDLPVVVSAFHRFSEEIQQSYKGKLLARRIAMAQQLDAGKTAPEISLLDTTGQPVLLSSLRGKYVLLCFWSSSVQQSRALISAAKQTMERLAGKNITLFSVACERDWNRWQTVLRTENMPGIQVIDMDGTNSKGPVSEVAKAYDLHLVRLPQCFLLDREGKIIARNLPGNTELPANVEKLINEHL
jgi:peroxiredoxin